MLIVTDETKLIDETHKRLAKFIAAEIEKGILLHAPKDWKLIVEELSKTLKESLANENKLLQAIYHAERARDAFEILLAHYSRVDRLPYDVRSNLVAVSLEFDKYTEARK